ncbi:unnamed protein product, partial [Closterium sp. NIES-53]
MTVPLPSTPPPPRDFLTEYSLGRHLGKGAFGEVLECTHNATGRQFACKRIGKRLITSESDAAEVRKEVAILQQLTAAGPSRHGGIVQLVEALEDGVAVYLVMELCEGGDLFELIKSDHAAGMPEDMAREIFHQVALAVAYCHTRGVLHRDIKPENILFTGPNQPPPVADSGAEFGAEFGVESVAAECSQKDFGDSSAAEWRWRVRVADFGLALFLPHGHMGQGMAGSRFYTAPEMVRGRKYGKRADVWSMGVVLCAMLTGRVPFAGKDRADEEGLRRSILRGAINFSAPAWAPVSAGARDLVRRMLEVDPRRRLKAAEVLQHPWVLGLELPDLTAADAAADVVMSADPAGSEEKLVPVKAQAESNLAVAAKASCPVDSKEAGEEERERTMNAKQNEFQQQTEQQAEGSTQMVSSSAAPPPVAPPVFSPRAPPTAPRVASPIRSAAFPIRPASPDRPVGSPIPIRPIAQPPLGSAIERFNKPPNLPASNVSHSGCPSFNSPCPSQSSAFQSTPPSSASRSSPSRSSPPPLSSSLSPSLSNSTATSASTFTQMDAADMDECGMADGAGGFDVMAADGMAGDASLSIPLSLCLPPISVCRKKSRREEYEEAFVPGSPWFSPRPLPLTAGQLSHKQQQQQQQESVRKEYEEASLAFSPWFSPRPLPLVAAPFSHEKQQHEHRYHQQQQQQQQVHCPVGSSLSGDEFSNNSSMCGASSALSFQAASRCFMAFNPWGSLRIHTVPNTTTTTTTTTSGFSGGNGGTTHAPDSGIEALAEGFKKSHLQPLYNENQPPVNVGRESRRTCGLGSGSAALRQQAQITPRPHRMDVSGGGFARAAQPATERAAGNALRVISPSAAPSTQHPPLNSTPLQHNFITLDKKPFISLRCAYEHENSKTFSLASLVHQRTAESPRSDNSRSPAAVVAGDPRVLCRSVDPSSIRSFDTRRVACARLHSANPDAAAPPTPRIRSAFVPSASPTASYPLAHPLAHAHAQPHAQSLSHPHSHFCSHAYSRTRRRIDPHLISAPSADPTVPYPLTHPQPRPQFLSHSHSHAYSRTRRRIPPHSISELRPPSINGSGVVLRSGPLGFGSVHGSWSGSSSSSLSGGAASSAASTALGSGGLGFRFSHCSWASSSSSSSSLSGASGGGGFLGFSSPSKKFQEKRLIGYSPEQVFDVVAGVERYADFLPWCVGSHVLWRAPDGMEAELEIGFHMLREKYLSRVTYKRPLFVTARSADTGLFHHLDNHWEFAPGRLPGSCLLSFSVDFQFRSLLYTQFLDLFFDEVVSSLVNSFERRCKEIYGPSK